MPVRVGIVGWGEIARLHRTFLERAGAVVSGIVSRRTLPLDCPVYSSLEALLPRVDAVTIAVPNFLHAEYALQTLRAGKAVFVEKPLCLDGVELDRLEEALFRHRLPFRIGYRLRWSPAVREWKAGLARVCRIECSYRLGIERLASGGKEWTRRVEQSGGALMTLGVHAYDLARWLAGAQGEPLGNLQVRADSLSAGVDFPLRVSFSGCLNSGVELQVKADLRGDLPYLLSVGAEFASSATPSGKDLRFIQQQEAADSEYQGMMSDFVKAVRKGQWERDEVREYVQTHRDLIRVRQISESLR